MSTAIEMISGAQQCAKSITLTKKARNNIQSCKNFLKIEMNPTFQFLVSTVGLLHAELITL